MLLLAQFTNMSQDRDYWGHILSSINDSQDPNKFPKCIPLIGDEASTPWIPTAKDIASKWAKDHGYPLEDSSQLSRVAQFLALDQNESFPKEELLREFGNRPPPDFSLKDFENTAYSVLADLNLPIYITTNYDLLMEAALKAKGKKPVSEFCRWNDRLIPHLKRAGIKSIFDKGGKYAPKPENPLVYHLYGLYRLNPEYRLGDIDTDIDLAYTLVLTEEDYINFALALNQRGDSNIFPPVIRKAFSISSLLFIGYNIGDLGFRILFQGVVSPYIGPSLAVQLPPGSTPSRAIEYLDKYTEHMFKVRVYWGDPSKFCQELRERWENFKRKQSSSNITSFGANAR